MSIQGEITRINGNVQGTIEAIREAGIAIPSGANSDNLPGLAAALSNAFFDSVNKETAGRALVSNAVTDMGVPTAADSTYEEIAENIREIDTVGENVKSALVYYLVEMGVPASADEELEDLVEKVRLIPQGDTTEEMFVGMISGEYQPSYGFFSTGETASLQNKCSIEIQNKAASLRVRVSGEGADTLVVTAPGWTQTTGENQIVLQYDGPPSRFDSMDALNVITFEGDGTTSVTATITFEAVMESGAVLSADGGLYMWWYYGQTWETLEGHGVVTWGDMEDLIPTWSVLKTLGKPEVNS